MMSLPFYRTFSKKQKNNKWDTVRNAAAWYNIYMKKEKGNTCIKKKKGTNNIYKVKEKTKFESSKQTQHIFQWVHIRLWINLDRN